MGTMDSFAPNTNSERNTMAKQTTLRPLVVQIKRGRNIEAGAKKRPGKLDQEAQHALKQHCGTFSSSLAIQRQLNAKIARNHRPKSARCKNQGRIPSLCRQSSRKQQCWKSCQILQENAN